MSSNPREVIGLALSGNVLEIGPGSRPFTVAPDAKVSYADRSVEGGRDANWPELIGAPAGVQAQYDLNLDTDGLSAIDSATLDGVVASHVIEHVANPLAVLKEFSRVLRPGGKLLLVVPDRQYTFDAPRVPTPFSTVQAKFKAGVTEVDEQSIREFCEAIYAQPPMHPPQVREWHDPQKLDAERLALHRRRSIHVHCWSPEEFASLITASMLEISVSWTLIDLYCADHFPNGQANEFAVLLQKVPETSATDAAQAFVQRWTDLSLRDGHVNPSRLVKFHLALSRDLGEMAAGEFPHLCEKGTPDAAVAESSAQRDAAIYERQTLDEKFRLLQEELASSASHVGYETQRADAAAARVAALEGSTSWKITAPLRALVKAIRGR
jgi:SAM-dependent methyltransferase